MKRRHTSLQNMTFRTNRSHDKQYITDLRLILLRFAPTDEPRIKTDFTDVMSVEHPRQEAF